MNSDWQSQLDDLIKSALLSFSSIPQVSQIGIEVAVPQHKTPNNPRKKQMSTKMYSLRRIENLSYNVIILHFYINI